MTSTKNYITLAVAICFILNFLKFSFTPITILNSVSLFLCLLLVNQQKLHPLFYLSAAITPLFSYRPAYIHLAYFNLIFLASILVFKKPVLILPIFLLALLLAQQIINLPLSMDQERLIWVDQLSQATVSDYQTESVYLPYRLRPLVYNQSIYAYQYLQKLANFISLSTFLKSLLLVNFIAFLVGLIVYFNKSSKKPFWQTIFLTAVVATGINKSAHPLDSLYLASLPLLYFISLGSKRFSPALFSLLFLLTLFLGIHV